MSSLSLRQLTLALYTALFALASSSTAFLLGHDTRTYDRTGSFSPASRFDNRNGGIRHSATTGRGRNVRSTVAKFRPCDRTTVPGRLRSGLSNNADDDEDENESSSFDMEDLRRRMEMQRRNDDGDSAPQEDDDALGLSFSDGVENVYIIVYNPDSEDQGVHTLEVPKGSGINFILAFESELECLGFGASLREQGFFDPKVQEINLASLEEHCGSLDKVSVQPVPKGSDLKPPTEQVDELGLNPNRDTEVSFVDYLYRMSSAEGSDGGEDGGDGGALLSSDDDDGGDGSWE